MDEKELVAACARGDKEAWDEFVEQYSRLIYSYILSIIRSKGIFDFPSTETAELFQEIFVLLSKDNFKRLKSYTGRSGATFATWLRQVVINFTIDYLRKRKTNVSLDALNENGLSLGELLASPVEKSSVLLETNERALSLRDCINQLEEDDQYFIELSYHQEFSLREIAELLSISRQAVDMRKHRIVARLKNCFQKKGNLLDF